MELAALFFEDAIPVPVLLEHHPEELIGYINIGMTEPESEPTARKGKGDDDLGAAILRVADRYKTDPLHIYAAWPAWMLNAAIEALPRVAAFESIQTAEAVQVGNGNMKPGTLRNVQNGSGGGKHVGRRGTAVGRSPNSICWRPWRCGRSGIRCLTPGSHLAELARLYWSSRPTPRG